MARHSHLRCASFALDCNAKLLESSSLRQICARCLYKDKAAWPSGFLPSEHIPGSVHIAADTLEFVAESLLIVPAVAISSDTGPKLEMMVSSSDADTNIPYVEIPVQKFKAFAAGHRDLMKAQEVEPENQ